MKASRRSLRAFLFAVTALACGLPTAAWAFMRCCGGNPYVEPIHGLAILGSVLLLASSVIVLMAPLVGCMAAWCASMPIWGMFGREIARDFPQSLHDLLSNEVFVIALVGLLLTSIQTVRPLCGALLAALSASARTVR